MTHNKRLWKIICLITALSVFFVVMVEARPTRFLRPPVKKSNFHVLTERQCIPELAFFWNASQMVVHYTRDLSKEQKSQLREAFWNTYVQTVALQEDASDDTSVLPKETASSTQIELVFAGYLKALDGIFTPEQQNQHQKRFPRAKSPRQFLVVTYVRTPQVTSGALAEARYARSYSYTVDDTTGVTQQYAWTTLVQVDSQTPFYHDLSQLQTLRL